MSYNVLYPHERIAYRERQQRYYDLTLAMFSAALGAELEDMVYSDEFSEGRLAIQLDNLAYYGGYYALYSDTGV